MKPMWVRSPPTPLNLYFREAVPKYEYHHSVVRELRDVDAVVGRLPQGAG
jgi:hypothetical protein